MTHATGTIRRLNDELRKSLQTGIAVITPGIAALGQEAVQRIFQTVSTYDNFCRENDPYGEHDFGSFEANGQKVLFKIDYYDKRLNSHSPDPANPAVTERVITIMLASEY